MRLSATFVIPRGPLLLSALVALSLTAGAAAQDAARPDPGAPIAPNPLNPMSVAPLDTLDTFDTAAPLDGVRAVPVDERVIASLSGEHLLRIDGAREALAVGDRLTSARELRRASNLLRLQASRVDARAQPVLLAVAARLAASANDIELGYVDQPAFDRSVSSALRALTGHHLAVASESVARGDRATAAQQLRLAADALERASAPDDAPAQRRSAVAARTLARALEGTRALADQVASGRASAAEVERGLARLGQALDDETALAGRGEPASAR